MLLRDVSLFRLHLGNQPFAFLIVQPLRVLRPVGQVRQHRPGQQDGRRCLDQEEPLPAMQSEYAVHGQQCPGNGRTDGDGDGHGGHEEGGHARAMAGRKPVAQVEDDPREKARLGSPEQEAQNIQADRPLHECRRARDDPPGEHDPGNPHPRPDPVQDEVRRDLEQKVADEEYPGGEPECRRGKPEILVHGQGGESDVDPVQVGDEIEQHDERHDPARQLANHSFFKRLGHGGSRCHGVRCHGVKGSPGQVSTGSRCHGNRIRVPCNFGQLAANANRSD